MPANFRFQQGFNREDVASANLVLNEGTTVLVRSGEEIIDLLKGGQGVLNIVPMAGVVSELDTAIHDLRAVLGQAAILRIRATASEPISVVGELRDPLAQLIKEVHIIGGTKVRRVLLADQNPDLQLDTLLVASASWPISP